MQKANTNLSKKSALRCPPGRLKYARKQIPALIFGTVIASSGVWREKCMNATKETVDDRGTGQAEAKLLLENMYAKGFESDIDKLSLALGRSVEELNAMLAGSESIDDDLVMKIRGIAINRGIAAEDVVPG